MTPMQANVTQEEFNKAFNEILEGSTQRYINPETGNISKKKTLMIQVLNSKGEWLIDYNTDPKNSYFYYQDKRVYCALRDKFSLLCKEFQPLMKNLVEKQYKTTDTTPIRIITNASGWNR